MKKLYIMVENKFNKSINVTLFSCVAYEIYTP